MAASLLFKRATSEVLKGVFKPCKVSLTFCSRRYLLSEAYICKEAWKKRLDDPILRHIPLSEFAIQLRDQYEKEKIISAIDMEILANKLHEMDIDEAGFMEDLMVKFRKSPDANPVRDCIVYVMVRSYIDKGLADRLLSLMQARSKTGLFPDPISASLLLDHFIEEKDFASAALVAYELMLQEEVIHPTARLLSLYAAVHHLERVSVDEITPEKIEDPSGEESWEPVKYIRYPTYDDHFDIQWQQYLLGKTLWCLGKTLELGTVSNSLQVVGLALYHKFGVCLELLCRIADAKDGAVVQDCLKLVGECLERVQLRDPKKPEKEVGLLRMEDEVYKLLPTQEEREGFQDRLKALSQRLQEQGQVSQDRLSALVANMVTSQLPQHEAEDIKVQTSNLEQWREERQTLVQEQTYQLEKRQKIQEIQTTLRDLQEKEEMVRFFELYNQVCMSQPKKLTKAKVVEDVEDEEALRAKRIKRRKYRHNV